MLVATCPKCEVPIWRGTFENIPDEDVRCWVCENRFSVNSCEKHDSTEWRETLLTSKEYTKARNIFLTNMYAVAEKMDLPTYLAEWGLLTMKDLETGKKGDLAKIFREEIKWMIERILKRMSQRTDSAS